MSRLLWRGRAAKRAEWAAEDAAWATRKITVAPCRNGRTTCVRERQRVADGEIAAPKIGWDGACYVCVSGNPFRVDMAQVLRTVDGDVAPSFAGGSPDRDAPWVYWVRADDDRFWGPYTSRASAQVKADALGAESGGEA